MVLDLDPHEIDEKITFNVVDFAVFFGMLGLTMVVGIFYAIKDRKQETMDTYYFGGKNMSPIPVGLSISVTWISAITMLTLPVETYFFGLVNAWYCMAGILPTMIHCVFYIPLTHRLKLSSIYEFFERRFDHRIRKLESFIMCLVSIFFMAITIYLPGLALSAVTPMSITITIIITGTVCTFYTSLGGMKAVVWVDTLQAFVMLAGMLAVLIRTVILLGGFENLFELLDKGERTNFLKFDPDPTLRNSFWTIIFGCAVTWSTPSQAIIQRYMACGSTKKARQAALIAVFPKMMFASIGIMSGAAMYGYYYNCDPLEDGKIEKPDQMMPFMVLDIFQDLPGMAGLFVAAVFSATLSTVSSGINAIASLLMEDFIVPAKPKLSQAVQVTLSKLLVCFFGTLVTSLAMGVMHIDGTVFRIAYTLVGVAAGPLLGVFVLGMLLPWCSTKGAFIGQLVGTTITGWIAFSGYFHGQFHSGNHALPANTDGCGPLFSNNASKAIFQTTLPETTEAIADSYGIESTLYAVSFLYYGIISLVSTVSFGLIGSFATGANKPSEMDPVLFFPIISHPIFPATLRRFFRFGVPQELQLKVKGNMNNSNGCNTENDSFLPANEVFSPTKDDREENNNL